MKRWGVNFQRKADYYSPLPDWDQLITNRDRWNKPSQFKAIGYDVPSMARLASECFHTAANDNIPHVLDLLEYGEGYHQVDAHILYGLLRKLKPKRYVEIGGGMSTYFANMARRHYRDEVQTHITTYEPFPYPGLPKIENVELKRIVGQDIPLHEFDELESGDVLFVDSSHVVKIDGEVNYIILEILPRLKKGVWIHFHDIPFPYNFPYPAEFWILDREVKTLKEYREPMYWTEPMLLQAFLMYNSSFSIELSIGLLRYHRPDFIQNYFKASRGQADNIHTASSIWIRKKE